MNISNEASKYLAPERVNHLYGVAHRRRALLAEARAAVTNELLSAWRPESRSLVDALEHSLEGDQAKIAAFESALPAFEAALVAEREATEELARAQHAHAQGSTNRKEQLARRDDLEAALGVATVRRAQRVAALLALPTLPASDGVAEGEGRIRDMVNTMAIKAENMRFRPELTTPIDEEVWGRWVERVTDLDMLWIPVFAGREMAKAVPESEDRNRRSERVTLPRADYAELLARFKATREARKAQKLAAARALVAQATAQLEGAAQ